MTAYRKNYERCELFLVSTVYAISVANPNDIAVNIKLLTIVILRLNVDSFISIPESLNQILLDYMKQNLKFASKVCPSTEWSKSGVNFSIVC